MESSNFHSYFSYNNSIKQEVIWNCGSSAPRLQDSCLLVLLAIIVDDLDPLRWRGVSCEFSAAWCPWNNVGIGVLEVPVLSLRIVDEPIDHVQVIHVSVGLELVPEIRRVLVEEVAVDGPVERVLERPAVEQAHPLLLRRPPRQVPSRRRHRPRRPSSFPFPFSSTQARRSTCRPGKTLDRRCPSPAPPRAAVPAASTSAPTTCSAPTMTSPPRPSPSAPIRPTVCPIFMIADWGGHL